MRISCFLVLCLGLYSLQAELTLNSNFTPWPVVNDAVELETVTVAAGYVVALLNLRQVFVNATALERLLVAYRCPVDNNGAISSRYFLVMDVTEGDDPFAFMVETYQDKLRNWQPILASPTKNFKESPSGFVDLTSDLWFAAHAQDSIIISAQQAAALYMETLYYPRQGMPNYRFEKLVHSEFLESTPSQRRMQETSSAQRQLEKLEGEIHALAGNLSVVLSIKKSRMLEYESKRSQAQDALGRNVSRDSRTAAVVDEWLRFHAAHQADMETLEHDASALDQQLNDAAQEKDVIGARLQEVEAQPEPQRRARHGARGLEGSTQVHAYLVLDFLPADVLQAASTIQARVLMPSMRDRRQLVLFNGDWPASGVLGWSILATHPFVTSYH